GAGPPAKRFWSCESPMRVRDRSPPLARGTRCSTRKTRGIACGCASPLCLRVWVLSGSTWRPILGPQKKQGGEPASSPPCRNSHAGALLEVFHHQRPYHDEVGAISFSLE